MNTTLAAGVLLLAVLARRGAASGGGGGGGGETPPLPGAEELATDGGAAGVQPPAPVDGVPWLYLGRSASGPDRSGAFSGPSHVFKQPPGSDVAPTHRGLRAWYIDALVWRTHNPQSIAYRDGRLMYVDRQGRESSGAPVVVAAPSAERLSLLELLARNIQPRTSARSGPGIDKHTFLQPSHPLAADVRAWWLRQPRRHPRWELSSGAVMCPVLTVPAAGARYMPTSLAVDWRGSLVYTSDGAAGLASSPWRALDGEDHGGLWGVARGWEVTGAAPPALLAYARGLRTTGPTLAAREPLRWWDGSPMVRRETEWAYATEEGRVVYWRVRDGDPVDPVNPAHGYPEYRAPAVDWSAIAARLDLTSTFVLEGM